MKFWLPADKELAADFAHKMLGLVPYGGPNLPKSEINKEINKWRSTNRAAGETLNFKPQRFSYLEATKVLRAEHTPKHVFLSSLLHRHELRVSCHGLAAVDEMSLRPGPGSPWPCSGGSPFDRRGLKCQWKSPISYPADYTAFIYIYPYTSVHSCMHI